MLRWFFLKNRSIHFHISSTSDITMVKKTSWVFPVLKPTSYFLTQSKVSRRSDSKCRSQLYWLPQIRCLITLRVKSCIISIDSNIANNIIIWKPLIYSIKREGPWMDPWGTPELTGYSCKGFPSRTSRSCLLLRKYEIRPNT